jgi:hypothetical protein
MPSGFYMEKPPTRMSTPHRHIFGPEIPKPLLAQQFYTTARL